MLQIFAVFLAAAAIAPPLARFLRMGAVLGYLLAGIIIGQLVFSGEKTAPEDMRVMAELGVAMFLFLIGLELRPRRLWAMRVSIFGLGGAQVAITGALIALLFIAQGQTVSAALLVGIALSLSSTAFALQILDEKKELTTRHGRASFSVLLFQDIAAIPAIALVPLFAIMAGGSGGGDLSVGGALRGLAVVAGIIIAGRYVLNPLYRLVAATGVREAMTAAALLTVVAVALIMHEVNLSPSLGAFAAGVMLADSEFRHQIESDIFPFEGLLLGLFFMTVGMSLDLNLIASQPWTILASVVGLVALKAAVLFGLGRWQELTIRSSRRFALVLSQGGEFAFVLLAAAVAAQAVAAPLAEKLAVIVTLSMVTTPLLLLADDWWRAREVRAVTPTYDTPPKPAEGHVVIAGFGRVGQITARVLRANRIPFTALDISAEHVNFVNQFGSKIYYGDATRLGILEAAETGKARALLLAIDDPDASIRCAEIARQHFPHVPIYARARNRQHVHKLMDLGVELIERETFRSSLALTGALLDGLGMTAAQRRFVIDTFSEHDERRLYEDYRDASDTEKLRQRALKQSEELEEIFAQDAINNVPPEAGAPRAGEQTMRSARAAVAVDGRARTAEAKARAVAERPRAKTV